MSRYDDKDIARWHIDRPSRDLVDGLSKQLPLVCDLAVSRAVKTYGKDTYALLQEVYRTEPMLRARPGETLMFRGKSRPFISAPVDPVKNPGLRRKLKAIKAKWDAKKVDPDTYWYGGPQRHHAEGLAAFEAEEATTLQDCTFDVTLDESLWDWGSRAREDELSR